MNLDEKNGRKTHPAVVRLMQSLTHGTKEPYDLPLKALDTLQQEGMAQSDGTQLFDLVSDGLRLVAVLNQHAAKATATALLKRLEALNARLTQLASQVTAEEESARQKTARMIPCGKSAKP